MDRCNAYISDNLPEDMLSADFFAPSIIDINPERSPDFKFNNFVIHGAFASYFMYSKKPHNYIFDCMAAFFEEYWKDKSWYDYYLIYEFSAVAMEEDKRFFDEILNMLRHHYYPEEQFLQLSKIVTQKFDLAKWTKIKKFPIHKICGAVKLTGELKKGSFAEKLANGELN